MSDFHPGSWNPAWSVATILTGLLSFMLSDEMTTGSVTSSESHKRAFAARSHSWNITQQRFKDAFPEYCAPVMRELPNMGEKERGKPDVVSSPPSVSFFNPPPVSASSSTSSSFAAPRNGNDPVYSSLTVGRIMCYDAAKEIDARQAPQSNSVAKPDDPNRAPAPPAPGWTTTWRHFIYEKWRLCAFIALAVMLSRFSTRT
jgi:ubiquitin-conjugating enzyme E2 J2